MKSINRVSVLVVAFLGVPETTESKLKSSEARYVYTRIAFSKLQKKINNQNLYLGLVGDQIQCNRFILEAGLGEENAKWFDQERSLISKGVGALENQLLVNCIKFWSFEEKFDLVIKVTGKYDVLNIEDIFQYTQMLNQPFFAWKYFFKKMVDTRVFIFKPCFYLANQNSFKKINTLPGNWVENIAYQILKENFFSYGMLVNRPILKGWAGTTNEFSLTPIYKRILICIVTKLVLQWKKASLKIESLLKLFSL